MPNGSNRKINILGILSFADESILELKLGHKFYIEAMYVKSALDILENLGPISDRDFLKAELDRLSCIDKDISRSNKIFVVRNSFKKMEDAELEPTFGSYVSIS